MIYEALRWLFGQILRRGFGLTVSGGDHIPDAGPVILAANHPSQIDPVVLAAALPRRCTFLAAAELLTMPVLGALIWPFRPIPIRRGHGDGRAIKACLERLGRGEALVIFPEGKISPDGRLQPPHDGLALVASRAGVPVIPVGIRGTYQVWPLGTRVPHRGQIAVRVGEAIMPDGAAEDGEPNREHQAALTQRVMAAIAGLAGEVIPPEWPKRRKNLGAAADRGGFRRPSGAPVPHSWRGAQGLEAGDRGASLAQAL